MTRLVPTPGLLALAALAGLPLALAAAVSDQAAAALPWVVAIVAALAVADLLRPVPGLASLNARGMVLRVARGRRGTLTLALAKAAAERCVPNSPRAQSAWKRTCQAESSQTARSRL